MLSPAARADPRLSELDALRGLAALVVLLHHAVQLIPWPIVPGLDSEAGLGRMLFETTPLRVFVDARAAVLLFFVLSGYVLTRSLLRGATTTSLAAYAVQRSLRILVPAAAAIGLSVLLRFAAFDATDAEDAPANHFYIWFFEPAPLRLVADFLLFRNDFNVVLWSLAHEWRLTVLLPLVLVLRRQPLLLLGLAVGVMTLGRLAGATEDEVFLPREPLLGLAATLYFAPGIGAGCALAMAGSLPRLSRPQRWAASIGIVAAFSMPSDLASYAGAALLIILAQQPSRLRTALRWSLFTWLGQVSFSLYLIHVPLLLAAWHLLHRHLGTWTVALAGVSLSLLVAPLFFHLVEEPSRRLARRAAAWMAPPGPSKADAGSTPDVMGPTAPLNSRAKP